MNYKTYYTCTRCKEISRSTFNHIYDLDNERTVLTDISRCCEQPVSIERVLIGEDRGNLKRLVELQSKEQSTEIEKCRSLYKCQECNTVSQDVNRKTEIIAVGSDGYLILTHNKSICCGDTVKILKNFVHKDI
jgi:hypothetical protein